MQDYTVMIFRDHASPVRRYKVARRLVKRAGAMAVGAVLLTGLLLVDYVRVRGDVVELDALREETHQQREEIERFTTRMQELDERFARLRDFERKVRVIADLPRSGVAEVGEVPSGVGGGFESDDPDAAEASDLPPATGDPSTAPGASGPVTAPMGSWFARLDRDARALLVATRVREESLEDLVERLRGKSERLASTPSVWPAKGWLTSKFGRRVSPFTGKTHFHYGIDIAAEAGTEVVAPARGTVRWTGRKGPLGNTLIVDHGYGIETTYGHLEEIHVKRGQPVQRGQWIASMGSTGRSTGPHLHYSVAVNGHAVDPEKYILD